MKLLPLLIATSLLMPTTVEAQSRSGFSNQCFKEVYREEYIPGTRNNPGRIRTWTEKVEIPCDVPEPDYTTHTESTNLPSWEDPDGDHNSCIEGSIIGGIAGAGIGGAMATEENWIWSIPAGVVGGAMLGCQIDGG